MVLFLFNVKAWLLWGVIMFVLAAVPVLSIGIILIPAGLIRMLSGSLWQGIVIISLSLLIIAVTEGMLRPRLVGKFIGIHDAVVFISMIGGLVTLGPSGFIIGPLIAAVLSALLDIVEMENNKTS
jgi:predicted PurR-regulated permease PerM